MTNSLISEITGQNDIDPAETREWIEALQAVLEQEGSERAQDHFLKLRSVF
jgi:pyruvate dehydrogenase E1 component